MSDEHLIESLVARQELFQGNFLHALRDTVRLPDGAQATREYVVHPGAVVVVPLLEGPDGQLHIVLGVAFTGMILWHGLYRYVAERQ